MKKFKFKVGDEVYHKGQFGVVQEISDYHIRILLENGKLSVVPIDNNNSPIKPPKQNFEKLNYKNVKTNQVFSVGKDLWRVVGIDKKNYRVNMINISDPNSGWGKNPLAVGLKSTFYDQMKSYSRIGHELTNIFK